jgi:iron complex outermembrane receptor protein
VWGLEGDDEKNFSAYLEGRNLSDKAYISSTSINDRATPASRLFNPGTGRGVFAGVRTKL